MAYTFRDVIRYAADIGRGIPGYLGLRRYQVYLCKKNWSGGDTGMPGDGYVISTVETELTVNGQAPRVKEVNCNMLLGSGYENQEIEIGPISKNYIINGVAGGWLTDGYLAPDDSATGCLELYIKIKDNDNLNSYYYNLTNISDISIVSITLGCKKRSETTF